MSKKIMALVLIVFMIISAGCCAKEEEPIETKATETTTAETTTIATTESTAPKKKKVRYLNPLTGVKDLKKKDINNRPVAIMVNNLSTAQTVQTGVGEADIVYETEVEGGITRLMAVYQDVAEVRRIGTVRSARYDYIDLAMGHNAIYIHHGADNVYAGPHLSDVDRMEISEGRYAERISNGLAYEHTLYTVDGKSLWEGLKNNFNTESANTYSWQNFTTGNEKVTPADGSAKSVSVPFSYYYNTKFVYEKKSGKYIRTFAGTERKDYFTGKKTKVKNVLVLLTTIGNMPNNKHKDISLDGGSGYYISNGKYQKISWSKGNASSPFVFTDANGNQLKMNAGKTWVCIASSSYSQPYFD